MNSSANRSAQPIRHAMDLIGIGRPWLSLPHRVQPGVDQLLVGRMSGLPVRHIEPHQALAEVWRSLCEAVGAALRVQAVHVRLLPLLQLLLSRATSEREHGETEDSFHGRYFFAPSVSSAVSNY